MSLIDAKSFNDVINFARQIDRHIVVTRGSKGAIAIKDNEITECAAESNLDIVDLTGAGDLFAAGYLNGVINNFSIKKSLEQGTYLSSKIIQILGARL
jgi:fructokinase